MNISEQSRPVFIFGAGASANCGAPLMKEFIDRAEDVKFQLAENTRPSDNFDLVFDALESLKGVHSKSNVYLNNIEDVLGTFEIGRVINKIGSLSKKEIERLPDATKIVITKTLEDSCRFRRDNVHIVPNNESDYHGLLNTFESSGSTYIELLKKTTFITFNYDVCLDLSLYIKLKKNGWKMDYGLNEAIEHSSVKLLKLHGSINWVVCRDCGRVFPLDWATYLNDKKNVPPNEKKVRLNFMDLYHLDKYQFFRESECKRKCTGMVDNFIPAVVPPSWNKTDLSPEIKNVWRHAADAMASADQFYIIGYSLPETDSFFRMLFALGSEGRARMRRFWVFNPDSSAKNRFDKIVSESNSSAYKFVKADFQRAIRFLFRREDEHSEKFTEDENGVIILPD